MEDLLLSTELPAAIFLDRDGVINENRDGAYVTSWEQFRFLPGALEAVVSLSRAGLPVIVVTNQSGIGRGHMSEAALVQVHRRMTDAIAAQGGRITAIMYCPHAPDDGCGCRKPRPGMLQQAAAQLELDLARCVFVGDHLTDVQAAVAAGCRPILVESGRGAESRQLLDADPDLSGRNVLVVADLPAAVTAILGPPA